MAYGTCFGLPRVARVGRCLAVGAACMVAMLGGLADARAQMTPEPRPAQTAPRPGGTGEHRQATPRDIIRLAIRHYQTGRCADAIPIAAKAELIYRLNSGETHPDLIAAINIQALCHKVLGQYEDAERRYRQSLAIAERIRGPESFELAVTLDNLANLYSEQQRLDQVEPLRRRAFEIFVKVKGPESPNTLTSMQNFASSLAALGRHREAEPLYRRALALADKIYGPKHPQTARLVDNLAGTVRQQGRLAEAGPLYERAIETFAAVLGPEHPDTALALQNHAILLSEIGDYTRSVAQLQRAIAINERLYGPDHPVLVVALNSLSQAYVDQEKWPEAVEALRRAARIIGVRRAMTSDKTASGRRGEQRSFGRTYRKLVEALLNADEVDAATLDEAFRTAQLAVGSEASLALTQMAVRFSATDPAMGALLRERQDLLGEADDLDQRLIGAAARPPAQRDVSAEAAMRQRILDIRRRVTEIGARLAQEFPGYTSLADPEPLAVAQVQALLRPNESLVLVLDVPAIGRSREHSVTFVVTPDTARWHRIPLAADGIAREVYALRCGLDDTAWASPVCERLLGRKPVEGVLPFDLKRSHGLYRALFGDDDEMLRGRELLMVLGGASSKLPPQVLVTRVPPEDLPEAEAYKTASWLGRRQPITVLPSVASLPALRKLARSSAARKPWIGFGNPVLVGPDGADRRAAAIASCADVARLPPIKGNHQTAQLRNLGALFKAGIPNVEVIRRQSPLPETAQELCAVATTLRAGADAVHLGARATERVIKDLDRTGELARYAILHFATHGLVAGNLPNLGEPALMLTPPSAATAEDDGLLTASEVTQLKLDADWVIMSACNTAAGGAASADALSGLARSFFYAGARSLLVSHWAVESEPTVRLITGAMEAMRHDPSIGRAEALRRSIVAMIDRGSLQDAHPASWAPFVLVGEGAAVEGGQQKASISTGALPATDLPSGPRTMRGMEPTEDDRKPAPRRQKKKQSQPRPGEPQDWKSDVFRE